jgi:CBS domain containing-hemolysin-like protein
MRAQVQEVTRRALALAALATPVAAHASFLSGDALDTAANWLSWFIIIVMPLVAIAIFWYVHILPEKIAEKRHHPQKDSIKVLCILSLFFGGLLWPFAWLWAYTRPVGFRAAYGTEKHEDYYLEVGEKARAGEIPPEEIAHLRGELHSMAAKGPLAPPLRKLLDDLDDLAARPAGIPAAAASAPAAPPVLTRAAEVAHGGHR